MIIAVKSPQSEIDEEAVRHAIRQHVDQGNLPKWAIPERVEFVDALDKTSVGKLDKKVLRQRYSRPTIA